MIESSDSTTSIYVKNLQLALIKTLRNDSELEDVEDRSDIGLRSEPNSSLEEIESPTDSVHREYEEIRKLQTEELSRVFLAKVDISDFEVGQSSIAEEFVKDELTQNSSMMRQAVLDSYVKSYAEDDVLAGILRVVSHLPYEDINPEGTAIVLGALSHQSTEIKELSVRTFENWEHPAALDHLKSISKIGIAWLDEYIEGVIQDLESVD